MFLIFTACIYMRCYIVVVTSYGNVASHYSDKASVGTNRDAYFSKYQMRSQSHVYTCPLNAIMLDLSFPYPTVLEVFLFPQPAPEPSVYNDMLFVVYQV